MLSCSSGVRAARVVGRGAACEKSASPPGASLVGSEPPSGMVVNGETHKRRLCAQCERFYSFANFLHYWPSLLRTVLRTSTGKVFWIIRGEARGKMPEPPTAGESGPIPSPLPKTSVARSTEGELKNDLGWDLDQSTLRTPKLFVVCIEPQNIVPRRVLLS